MNKTRVDDMLIEMITPQVKEIEEKFGRGEGLTQTDIHTLLLKSQYNHINHLDEKLDEVTADVSSLKGDFKELKSDFKLLEERVNNKMNNLENKFDTFKAEVREDIAKLNTNVEKKLKRL